MEPHGTTVGQKYTKEPREKNLLQRKWVSEPSAGTKRSTFADPDVKRHSHREQSLTSGTSLASSTHKFSSGKLLSSPQSSQESQFQQVYSLPYSYQLPHSYPQEPFLGGTKPQPGLESHAWSFSGQLPSLPPDDMFSVHSHSHGVFPRQKSPAAFGQFPQSGPEQPDESHKKEQKPKKPGKYICHYCGRACAKPSVLKKHIRSHTGERPYPCVPCGFSFKTKSNLYKHRKSHAHAIKAGLVPFSEITTRTDTDQASSVGEAEAHSDGEQSTDTDEETAEGAMFPEKHSPQISFESDKRPLERGPAYGDPAEELSVASMKVPILIVPKQGVPSTATEGPQFTEIKGSFIGGQMDRGDESHTVKQRRTLRLTEKKDQDSEQSQNLLSPHSKGSTDSGYFSRSESAEQQISPPNTNAKSYEEIMFGRTWYHRTNSRIRQSVTVKMATFANQDTNININKSSVMQELAMGKISEGRVFYQSDCAESQLVAGCDPKQYHSGSCQTNAGLLEAPSDSGTLIRSNSMPTPSPTNLNVPPSLRGSHSFDEMMTQDDVFYTAGLKRLQRQGAFEHSAQEGHGDSENYGKITGPNSSFKMGERGPVMPEFKCGTKEFATRKRRLKKSVGEEEDCLEQDDGSQGGSIEIPGDYEQRQGSQDSSKAAPANKGSMFRAHSPSDSFDRGPCITPEDVVLVQDSDTKTAGNVISVIQHTNSLSRPNSFEKTESIEHPFYQPDKPAGHHSEQSDTEIIDEVHIPNSHHRSESIKHQQQVDSEHGSFSSNFLYHMPHKLVRQPNIQVPEIRVTEEPDKPEKETEVQVKEPEKHVEEFQWPQRSETLSQLPSEKLPPKKKRLRLADMEHSSGESSFESTCTSLSRSPSQESNLSHSSSFSMSFDREESIKSMSPTKQDDFGKQSEFLTVPGSGHSLSIPGHHQREMRRSSSEQAPCALPTEVPEIRSKSFDYGSLSTGSRQGEVYASSSAMKERRRGYLVRQASLSVYPEVVVQETNSELNIKQEHSDHNSQAATSYCVTSDLARPRRAQPVLGSHHLQQQSISEDSLSEDNFQKTSRLPAQLSSDSEHSMHEHMSQDLIQHSSLQNTLTSSPFLPFQSMLWHPESTQRHKHPLAFQTHQLQKQHIKQPNLQPMLHKPHQPPYQIQVQTDSKTDGASHNNPYPLRTSPQQLGVLSSKVLSTNFLQQLQPVFATQNAGPQPALPELLVPVRIQTNMPSYGSVMYTSVSQILVTHAQSTTSIRVICSDNASTASLTSTPSKHQVGINLTKMLGHSGGSLHFPIWKVPEYLHGTLNTGIPLSLTSGTISSTDASSSIGGSKRMLSPASSLELFIETKQQKRVKEEKMYGQIVEELSAVELSNSNAPKDDDISHKNEFSKRGCSEDEQERMSLSPPTDFLSSKLLGYSPYLPDVPPKDSFIPPLQIITNVANRADSPEELDIDESTPEASSSPQSVISSDTQEESNQTKFPVNMLAKLAANQGGGVLGSTLVLTDLADVHQFFQFPSLCTPTSVSWCFLNYTKPNYAQTTPLTSVYGSWCVSSYNPNPLNLSTKATLALLRSKQRKNTEMYTMASMYQPGTGKLVSSLRWKQKFEQLKPALIQLEVGKFGKKIKGICSRDRGKEDHGEKEASSKQAEPTRIKIFDGGYKSNEDYVYVRGRGRGKYICEECGIRCKKPSMLKKHIRTHTDVRPYVCKFCNFAFKTKGNLTKHMKSKAHMKKCLELGVSVTSVDEGDAEEQDTTEEGHRASEMIGMSEIMAEHQFSDADDSEGAEEDGDDVDEDEDDDDEYDGDSTPKTQSRSTSPQPCAIPSLSITAVAASQESIPEHLGPPCKLPLSTYFTSLPSIQITQLMAPSEKAGDAQMVKYQKLLQGALGEDHKNRLDEDLALSPEHSSSSFDFSPSHLSSPGCDSSPLRESSPSSRRYLSPRRDLSPRGRLSTRRELSPLRHISPRRDVYRRDLSQRRDLSPRGHLSPISQTGRPTSPGRDLSGRLSPRCRNRGMIRPMSPRRGLPYQSGSWAPSPSPHAELMSLSQKTKSHLELEMDQRKTPHLQGDARNTDAPSIHQGLFSHLPLHSQQQIHHSTPFSMIPIGGIQMVHSVPTSVTVLAHPTRLLLQKSTSEESSTSEVSFHLSEGRWGSSRGPEASPQSQEKSVSPKAPSPYSLKSREDSADMPNKESKQEECIQTCTKAIASLCIASEETPEKSLVPIDPFHQHTLSHSPTAQQESAPTRAQHYCSSEITHPLHSRAESSMSATSKTPTANHPALYITEAAEKASGQQGHGERPTTIKKGKDLKDTINNR